MKFRAPAFRTFLLTLTVVATPGKAAAEPGWIPIGPSAGQEVESLVVLPGDPEPVIAAASSGIFRSQDGTQWGLLNGEEDLAFGVTGVLKASSAVPGPIYLVGGYPASSPDQILKSSDRGETWRQVKAVNGLLAVAELDPSRLYLVTSKGIEASRDAGNTWTPAIPAPIQELLDGHGELQHADVAFAPSDPETIYFLLELPEAQGFPDELRVVRTRDGGASWQVFEGPQGPELRRVTAQALVVDPVDPDSVYLVLTRGVFRSADGGSTWEPRLEGLPFDEFHGGRERLYRIEDLVIDPSAPEVLYAAIAESVQNPGGVYRSTDGGASWAPAHEGLSFPGPIWDLAFDPSDSAVLYAATPRGVSRSTDRGAHWSPTPGRLPTPAWSVVVDPETPATVFTGTADGRLFASEDGGRPWRRIGPELPATSFIDILRIAPADRSTLFAHYNLFHQEIGRSTDGGDTWQLLRGPGSGDVEELLIDPRNPARVLAVIGQPGGVYVSTDGGESWSRVLPGRIVALAQAPSDPDVLYAATLSSPPAPLRAEVCRSTDGGASWGCSGFGPEEKGGVGALAVDPRDSSVVLASLATGIHLSLDGGATWSLHRPGFSASELLFDPRDPEVLWANARHTGVFRSTDGGRSWTPMNRGLTHPLVLDLELDPSGRVLLAATNSGVFRFSSTGGPAPPAEIEWTTDPALAGFRVKARIAQGGGETIPGTHEPACIPETVCFSGALPGRSELFVRIVGPKPNGWLWPTLVKFSTSRIEVWIQQLSTGELRYYELRGASPGFDELPGLFDRFGFLPD